jgi:hypothetical protein
MNIFVLERSPIDAAKSHADKHVIKMILEACQMLYTAHWIAEYPHLLEAKSPIALSLAQKKCFPPPSLSSAPKNLSGGVFRPVHVHHPCTIWTRTTLGNYMWLAQLALALAKEKRYRWPSAPPHACEAHAVWLYTHLPPHIPRAPMTPFAVAMPDSYKTHDPIESYRAFYRGSKTDRGITNSYTRRSKPLWLTKYESPHINYSP